MNDQTAFKELYLSSKEYCFRVLSKWIISEEDTEDAFAEAISIYWIRFKQGKIKNHDNLKAYICKIALNLYRKKIKTSRTISNIDELSEFEHIPIDWFDNYQESDNESVKLFRKAFKKLGIDCQRMLTAKYVYHYKYEDIAEDMGRANANSIKVQTFRCVQYLKKIIETIKK